MFTAFRVLTLITTPTLHLAPQNVLRALCFSAFPPAAPELSSSFSSNPPQSSRRRPKSSYILIKQSSNSLAGLTPARLDRGGRGAHDGENVRRYRVHARWLAALLHDALATDGDTDSASKLVHPTSALLISALKRLVISRPALLGISAQTHEVGVPASDSQSHLQSHHSLDNTADMVMTAVVSNVVGLIGTLEGLSVQTAATKVQCIDQLDKADSPFIPEATPSQSKNPLTG